MKHLGYFDQKFNKRRLKQLIQTCFLNYGGPKTILLVENLKNKGYTYSTRAGLSLNIEDLTLSPSKPALGQMVQNQFESIRLRFWSGFLNFNEYLTLYLELWNNATGLIKDEVVVCFQAYDTLNPVYMMAFSGARGNISQVRQLVGSRGLMTDVNNNVVTYGIGSNFREGLTVTEYVVSCSGARKGVVDTALRTATAGYLTRRLVDSVQHVVVRRLDCGSGLGVVFQSRNNPASLGGEDISSRVLGRVLKQTLLDPSYHVLGRDNDEISARMLENCHGLKSLRVRSPLTCAFNRHVCRRCYGWNCSGLNMIDMGSCVGILAGQSIGEPGTQLTMRTFHTGGVFTGETSNQLYCPVGGFVFLPVVPGQCVRSRTGQIGFMAKAEGKLYVVKPRGKRSKKPFEAQKTSLDAVLPLGKGALNRGDDTFVASEATTEKLLKANTRSQVALETRVPEPTYQSVVYRFSYPPYSFLGLKHGQCIFPGQPLGMFFDSGGTSKLRRVHGLFLSPVCGCVKIKVGALFCHETKRHFSLPCHALTFKMARQFLPRKAILREFALPRLGFFRHPLFKPNDKIDLSRFDFNMTLDLQWRYNAWHIDMILARCGLPNQPYIPHLNPRMYKNLRLQHQTNAVKSMLKPNRGLKFGLDRASQSNVTEASHPKSVRRPRKGVCRKVNFLYGLDSNQSWFRLHVWHFGAEAAYNILHHRVDNFRHVALLQQMRRHTLPRLQLLQSRPYGSKAKLHLRLNRMWVLSCDSTYFHNLAQRLPYEIRRHDVYTSVQPQTRAQSHLERTFVFCKTLLQRSKLVLHTYKPRYDESSPLVNAGPDLLKSVVDAFQPAKAGEKPVKNTVGVFNRQKRVFRPFSAGERRSLPAFAGKAGKGRQKRVFRPFSAGERWSLPAFAGKAGKDRVEHVKRSFEVSKKLSTAHTRAQNNMNDHKGKFHARCLNFMAYFQSQHALKTKPFSTQNEVRHTLWPAFESVSALHFPSLFQTHLGGENVLDLWSRFCVQSLKHQRSVFNMHFLTWQNALKPNVLRPKVRSKRIFYRLSTLPNVTFQHHAQTWFQPDAFVHLKVKKRLQLLPATAHRTYSLSTLTYLDLALGLWPLDQRREEHNNIRLTNPDFLLLQSFLRSIWIWVVLKRKIYFQHTGTNLNPFAIGLLPAFLRFKVESRRFCHRKVAKNKCFEGFQNTYGKTWPYEPLLDKSQPLPAVAARSRWDKSSQGAFKPVETGFEPVSHQQKPAKSRMDEFWGQKPASFRRPGLIHVATESVEAMLTWYAGKLKGQNRNKLQPAVGVAANACFHPGYSNIFRRRQGRFLRCLDVAFAMGLRPQTSFSRASVNLSSCMQNTRRWVQTRPCFASHVYTYGWVVLETSQPQMEKRQAQEDLVLTSSTTRFPIQAGLFKGFLSRMWFRTTMKMESFATASDWLSTKPGNFLSYGLFLSLNATRENGLKRNPFQTCALMYHRCFEKIKPRKSQHGGNLRWKLGPFKWFEVGNVLRQTWFQWAWLPGLTWQGHAHCGWLLSHAYGRFEPRKACLTLQKGLQRPGSTSKSTSGQNVPKSKFGFETKATFIMQIYQHRSKTDVNLGLKSNLKSVLSQAKKHRSALGYFDMDDGGLGFPSKPQKERKTKPTFGLLPDVGAALKSLGGSKPLFELNRPRFPVENTAQKVEMQPKQTGLQARKKARFGLKRLWAVRCATIPWLQSRIHAIGFRNTKLNARKTRRRSFFYRKVHTHHGYVLRQTQTCVLNPFGLPPFNAERVREDDVSTSNLHTRNYCHTPLYMLMSPGHDATGPFSVASRVFKNGGDHEIMGNLYPQKSVMGASKGFKTGMHWERLNTSLFQACDVEDKHTPWKKHVKEVKKQIRGFKVALQISNVLPGREAIFKLPKAVATPKRQEVVSTLNAKPDFNTSSCQSGLKKNICVLKTHHVLVFQGSSWKRFACGALFSQGQTLQGQTMSHSGQLIFVHAHGMLLRRGRSFLTQQNCRVLKYQNEFVRRGTSLLHYQYRQIPKAHLTSGVVKVEGLFEMRSQKTINLAMNVGLYRAYRNYSGFANLTEFQDGIVLKMTLAGTMYVLNTVQNVLVGQGVRLSDKHLEIILKTMSSRVGVQRVGFSGLISGDALHRTLAFRPYRAKPLVFQPYIMGISGASYRAQGFLSPASFQETSRMLARGVMYQSYDFLYGLKEKVISGHHMDIGYDCLRRCWFRGRNERSNGRDLYVLFTSTWTPKPYENEKDNPQVRFQSGNLGLKPTGVRRDDGKNQTMRKGYNFRDVAINGAYWQRRQIKWIRRRFYWQYGQLKRVRRHAYKLHYRQAKFQKVHVLKFGLAERLYRFDQNINLNEKTDMETLLYHVLSHDALQNTFARHRQTLQKKKKKALKKMQKESGVDKKDLKPMNKLWSWELPPKKPFNAETTPTDVPES